jgi:hypothetical protein
MSTGSCSLSGCGMPLATPTVVPATAEASRELDGCDELARRIAKTGILHRTNVTTICLNWFRNRAQQELASSPMALTSIDQPCPQCALKNTRRDP